jgi:hypothetical protein
VRLISNCQCLGQELLLNSNHQTNIERQICENSTVLTCLFALQARKESRFSLILQPYPAQRAVSTDSKGLSPQIIALHGLNHSIGDTPVPQFDNSCR